jgi:hypothetical protein
VQHLKAKKKKSNAILLFLEEKEAKRLLIGVKGIIPVVELPSPPLRVLG